MRSPTGIAGDGHGRSNPKEVRATISGSRTMADLDAKAERRLPDLAAAGWNGDLELELARPS